MGTIPRIGGVDPKSLLVNPGGTSSQRRGVPAGFPPLWNIQPRGDLGSGFRDHLRRRPLPSRSGLCPRCMTTPPGRVAPDLRLDPVNQSKLSDRPDAERPGTTCRLATAGPDRRGISGPLPPQRNPPARPGADQPGPAPRPPTRRTRRPPSPNRGHPKRRAPAHARPANRPRPRPRAIALKPSIPPRSPRPSRRA